MSHPKFGGCFAPPLSDELLASYEQLANEATLMVRDTMRALLAPVKLWWSLPDSTGDGVPHASGRGVIVMLDGAIQRSLWDAIPWPHEISAMQGVVENIQAEQAAENERRMAAWRGDVARALKPQFITGLDFTSPTGIALQRVLQAIRQARVDGLPVPDEAIDATICGFYPSATEESVLLGVNQMNAWRVAVDEVVRGEREAPLPKPEMLDVRLRNAAHHLLWFVIELNNDREPLTSEKLLPKK